MSHNSDKHVQINELMWQLLTLYRLFLLKLSFNSNFDLKNEMLDFNLFYTEELALKNNMQYLFMHMRIISQEVMVGKLRSRQITGVQHILMFLEKQLQNH